MVDLFPMITPAPATIAKELQDRLTPYMLAGGVYRHVDDFEIRSLINDARKLIKADAASGYLFLALIYQLCGDATVARYHLENARKLNHDNQYEGASNSILINLGYFSEAQSHYRLFADPCYGQFLVAGMSGLACGAFHTVDSFVKQAEKMQLDLTNVPVTRVAHAAKVLENNSITDDLTGKIIDVAGEVMREYRIFYSNELPDIDVVDGFGENPDCVYMTYYVGVSAGVAAEMYSKLADRLCDRFSELPAAFHVGFRSAF